MPAKSTLARPTIFALLCAVARSDLDARSGERLTAAAAASIDWNAVPPLVTRHGLTMFAARHLHHVRDRVPDAIWELIQAQARQMRASALAMTAELLRMLDACTGRGLAVLPFKGPVLAWHAYRDFGARPFVDLDLLVHPQDVDGAGAVLESLGYVPEYRWSPARNAWFRRVDGDYPFVHATTGMLVELHARVASRRFGGVPTTDRLWQRRETMTIADRSVPVLGADDAFLVQALHGGKHRWERLEWVAAVAEPLRQRDGDVMSVIASAGAAERAVLLACALAADWLDAPLSADVREHLHHDPAVAALARDAWRHVTSDAEAEGAGATAAKLMFNFRLQRGAAARVRFAYRWVAWPSPEDWESLRLPDPLFFAYRAVRPVRLLGRYAGRLLHPDGTRHG